VAIYQILNLRLSNNKQATMIRFQLILFGLLLATTTFSQDGETSMYCEVLPIEQFREIERCDTIIGQLHVQPRLTTANASSIKLLSSNSFVAFEQTTDSIIKQHGTIEQGDIKQILKTTFNNEEYLIVITSYLGFGHAFKYDETHKELQRFASHSSLIFSFEGALQIEACVGTTILLFAKSNQQASNKWIKYYTIDLAKKSFINTKNCSLQNGIEECIEFR